MALSAPLQVLITRIYSVGRGQERAKLSVSMATANKARSAGYLLAAFRIAQAAFDGWECCMLPSDPLPTLSDFLTCRTRRRATRC